jgi:membrane-bound lytic murein transglycosylase D
MVPWLVGIILCSLLAGCGGSKANLVASEPIPQVESVSMPETDESLTEELSAKRLEELYAKSGIPGWDPGLEEELKQWEHQVNFDVPIQMNKQVRAYLVYFSTERKEIIRRYLSRSSRYLPMIKEIFQEYGLPEDLAYLAMIESGFSTSAYSPAHACGMWQFIRGTAARYGLSMDGYVDERRDPEKSTRAAAKYLLDLYKQFGSWYLAAASYNCGEGRVQKELNQSNHKNFWELSANECLPNETKNYVPQMIAATIIAKNPEKFGFKKVPYLPAVKSEQAQVHEPTSLTAVAVAVNVPVEEVQALNPELVRGMTPPDAPSYTLNLPPNSKELFGRNLVIAQIEHPAVASRPVRVARNTGRSYHSGAPSRQAASSRKAERKAKTVAKAGKKPTTQVASAKTGKGDAGSSPQLASMFGHPASVAKNSANGERKTGRALAAIDAKGKSKALKSQDKKGEQVAKKGEAGRAKNSNKNGAAPNRSKDKVSQAGAHQVIYTAARQ